MTTVSVKVAASGDDGYSGLSFPATGVAFQIAGSGGARAWFRFLNLTIPQGATINSATLTVYRNGTKGSTVSVTVSADDADNSAQPTSNADATGRTLTAGSATSTAAGSTNTAQTLNVATAVQAVVNRSGWSSGNALQLLTTASAAAISAHAYDNGNSAYYPTLDVDYTAPAGSMRFDAAADRLTYTGSIPPPTSGMTITAWVKLKTTVTSYGTWARIYQGSMGTTGTFGFDSDGLTGTNYFTGGGSVQNGITRTADVWMPVAVSASGTTGKAYIRNHATSTTTVSSGTVGTSTPAGICIGGRDSGDANDWFNGEIAQLRIWASELSQAQIEAEWASPTPVVTSGIYANWPLTNATSLVDTVAGRVLTTPNGTGQTTGSDAPPNGAGGTNASAGLASGTGAALAPTARVTATAGVASGSGAALNPTASTAPSTTANAGVAAGTGAALTPVAQVVAAAGVASGSGAALAPTARLVASAGVAAGTGQALAPVARVTAGAGLASGSGAALAPTAGSPAFAPTDVAGLVVWHKADSLALSDGATVDAWADSSGNGKVTEGVISGLRPTYETNEINSLPVVRFGVGGDRVLRDQSLADQAAQTLFAVVRLTSTSGTQTIRGPDNSSLLLRINAGVVELVRSGTALIGAGATTLSTATTYVIAATFANASTWAIYINGTLDGSGTHAQMLSTGGTYTYIGSSGTFGSNALLGDLGELYTYDSILSAGNRDANTSYLGTKWGVTVATGGAAASAGAATGTGAALAPTARVATPAGLASGVGQALAPTPNVTPAAGLASGTGGALAPSVALVASAGLAAGTGAALSPSASSASSATATPGVASAVGAALAPVVVVVARAGAASGNGAALTPSVSTTGAATAAAGVASGTGQALTPTVALVAPAGIATGTGAALNPTATTASVVTASAGVAGGTGTALTPTARVAATAGVATGVGGALAPAVALTAVAGIATGTGAALAPSTTSTPAVTAPAGVASGTGVARTPIVRLVVIAGLASGTGTALTPTASDGTPAVVIASMRSASRRAPQMAGASRAGPTARSTS